MKRRNFLKCTTMTMAALPFGVGAAAQAGKPTVRSSNNERVSMSARTHA